MTAMNLIEDHKPMPGRMPGRLSPRHYDLLTLSAAGKSYREIADALSLPLGTVKSGMHRAKAALSRLAARGATLATGKMEKPR